MLRRPAVGRPRVRWKLPGPAVGRSGGPLRLPRGPLRLPAAAWRRMAVGYAIAAFGLVGALSMIAAGGSVGGIYWVALETIGGLVWAITGAWRFLIGVVDERRS